MGAGNSAVVVDLPRCGPMLIRRVPNLVPIPGVTGSAHCAVRPLQGPRDHRLAPPTRRAAPTGRPPRTHRRRPELARGECGHATATEPSRVAGHRRHTVGLAPPPHRRALDPTTATAGPAVDLSEASPTRAAPRSRESDLGYRRVHGELVGLGHRLAASTVWQILNNAGIDPAPTRCKVTWSQFLRSQAAVACDFATIETVTLHRFYLLLCIDIATRTVYFAGTTDHPSGVWVTQAARNLFLRHADRPAGTRAPVRDCASQFIDPFDEIFRTERMKILKTPVRAPWRTRSPNAGSAPCDANSSTAPSSGTVANSTSLSSTTSIITTRTGPTVRSISSHPSPPTHQNSQTDTSKPRKRPTATDSSTSIEMPPDQTRHSIRHPQAKAARRDVPSARASVSNWSSTARRLLGHLALSNGLRFTRDQSRYQQ